MTFNVMLLWQLASGSGFVTRQEINIASGINIANEAGLFTWNMISNIMFADNAIADLLGLERDEAEHGLPLQRYLERIHVEDRAAVAAAIRHAIATGEPCQENYRVYGSDGTVSHVMSFGRSFMDAAGQPCAYAGIIFPMPMEPEPENKLLWHCLVAFDLAKSEGRDDVATQIRKVLLDIDWNGSDLKTRI